VATFEPAVITLASGAFMGAGLAIFAIRRELPDTGVARMAKIARPAP